jgi:Phage tail tube protein, GTA-gp10
MANPVRGETAFEADGTTYTLSFSINALCALEDAMGEGIMEITRLLSDPAKLRLNNVRTVFWAGLRDHHAEVDIDQAGKLMTALGQVEAIEMAGKALALAFPEAPKGPLGAAASGKRPAGTGRRS